MSAYEIISLIISGLAAIATTAAVLVALWQTKYANRKRLKCYFSENNTIVNPNSYTTKNYVGMNITNIGNKKVILSPWGIITNRNEIIMILTDASMFSNSDYFDKVIAKKTPYILDAEENVCFMYPKDMFLNLVKTNIESGKLNKDRKICFFVKDSTNKTYKIKSSKKAVEYISKEIKK